MQWAHIALWSGWYISQLVAQTIPGSDFGLPNCTNPCDNLLLTSGSGCNIFALNQSAAITCLCNDTKLFDTVVACVVSECPPADVETSFEIVVDVCHNAGLSLPTPSVSGFTLTAPTFAPSTVASSLSSTAPTILSSITVTSLTATTSSISPIVSPTATQGSNLTTATTSSKVQVFTGGANVAASYNLLAGIGIGLYCALL